MFKIFSGLLRFARNDGLQVLAFLTCFLFLNVQADPAPAAPATPAPITVNFIKQKNVQEFIDQMVKQHHFSREQLTIWFTQAQYSQRTIDLMTKPFEAKPWYVYQPHFISQQRINGGVEFWHKYADVLNQVQQRTGVPPEIIVSIIGVESHYGTVSGQFSVFNVLSTLAFEYPARSEFFTKELSEFLILSREQGWDPLMIKGSYAGALGQPQFMPSSYRYYAVPYTENTNKVNLFDFEPDVIASIGNYFKRSGWVAGQPVAVLAKVTGTHYQQLPAIAGKAKIAKPTLTLAEFKKQYDVVPTQGTYADNLKAIFLVYNLENSDEYWLGFNNFYAITRYNISKHYALAVYQLSEAIRDQYEKTYPAENAAPTLPSPATQGRGNRS
jgi:membrane-bound lytic murein transglycosylase B